MLSGATQSMSALLPRGADLAGLCVLAGLLAVSAWTCLRPRPPAPQGRPSAGQARRPYLLLCAAAAPLLIFASLAAGLAPARNAPLPAPEDWRHYRTLLWLLYGAVGLQQLFALQRMAFQTRTGARRPLLLAGAGLILLPLAMALGVLALNRYFALRDGFPAAFIAAAALAAVSGILLWLPAQLLAARPAPARRAEPAPAEPAQPGMRPPAASAGAAAGTPFPGRPDSAREMARQLDELSALLEQERQAAEQASHRALLEQDEAVQESTISQQVHEQKFLFESGLPCNLGTLVNGLIILDQPLDLRDHVRGDSLLHAVVRDGKALLAQQLIDNGAALDAVNWAGVTPRACTQDPAMLELLDAAARSAK